MNAVMSRRISAEEELTAKNAAEDVIAHAAAHAAAAKKLQHTAHVDDTCNGVMQ